MLSFIGRPERKQLRLSDYDYSSNGHYFVTICTENKMDFFGEIQNGIVGLSDIGCIAAKFWQEIPEHFDNVKLGEWIIMPNHLHGILRIDNPDDIDNDFGLYRVGGMSAMVKPKQSIVGDADLRPLQSVDGVLPMNQQSVDGVLPMNQQSVDGVLPVDRTKMLLPKIIHGFKSSVIRYIRKNNPDSSFGWQRSYYDHIIRNFKSYDCICDYIQNNPWKWHQDVENLKNKFTAKEIKKHYNDLLKKFNL